MADIVDDKAALAHPLKQVLVVDADALILLMLEQAGVCTASDFMPLEASQHMCPAVGSDKVKKTSHYFLQRCVKS